MSATELSNRVSESDPRGTCRPRDRLNGIRETADAAREQINSDSILLGRSRRIPPSDGSHKITRFGRPVLFSIALDHLVIRANPRLALVKPKILHCRINGRARYRLPRAQKISDRRGKISARESYDPAFKSEDLRFAAKRRR